MTVVLQNNEPTIAITAEQSTVVVNEEANAIEIIANNSPSIEAIASTEVSLTFFGQGPQGAIGPQGEKGINLDETAKINGSIIYYDAASSKFKADASVTKTLITDGGNY